MSEYKIPYNKPYLAGRELDYIAEAFARGHVSGNGHFTRRCHQFFNERFGWPHTLLTSSCTDALEMAALLLELEPGDEVIVPTFTFTSTANAFVLRGAQLVFADTGLDDPNVSPSEIEGLITPRTKAIVVVHYAGIACDMDPIMDLAKRHNLVVIEDAAHAFDSFYKGRRLGSIGDLATFSFHETKNIICGEGGLLVVNNERFWKRAEIVWEKGTNRAAFARGEVAKYTWVDIGSSFLPSDISAAFLFAQLQQYQKIQAKRVAIWQHYFSELILLEQLGHVRRPIMPEYASVNGHIFYLLCEDRAKRDGLIDALRNQGILAVFHYLPLDSSPFIGKQLTQGGLPNAQSVAERIVRLPLFFELTAQEIEAIVQAMFRYFETRTL